MRVKKSEYFILKKSINYVILFILDTIVTNTLIDT